MRKFADWRSFAKHPLTAVARTRDDCEVLHRIEQIEACLAPKAIELVVCDSLFVAQQLELFTTVVLDCLKVNERINGL